MRRSIPLLLLFVSGCGSGNDPKRDAAAARDYVRSCFNPAISVEMVLDEPPEYASIPKIPRERLVKTAPDRSATCGIRVRVTYRDEGRTSHDDWIVWVGGDHKGVAWSSNNFGDTWREHVQSLAQK
jgi:hypothetical protein